MGLIEERKLCLFEIAEIKFPDKITGSEVTKFKYSFFDSENAVIVGYLDKKIFTDQCYDIGIYSDEKAFVTGWTGREFGGEIKWRMIAPNADTSKNEKKGS